MSNLLQETLHAIQKSNHEAKDVVYIGSKDGEYTMTWEEFQTVADVHYDSGYGAAEVAEDLVIKFSDNTHMYREEYDGSEWWEYVSPIPTYPKGKPVTNLVGGMWHSVAALNTPKESE